MNRITIKTSMCVFASAILLTFSSCRPDEDDLPTPPPALTDYCGDISTATTWTNNREGVDYRVGCTFTITSALVIEEGTEIEFKSGTGIIIGSGGTLIVNGTAAKTVAMHGTSAAAGSWKGLWFQSSNPDNALKHCIINGGGQESFNGHDIKANVRVALNAKVAITNTTIGNSSRDGLYIEGLDDANENPITSFANNTFSNNINYPITIVAPVVDKLDGSNSTYTGNGKNEIEVRGGVMFGAHIWQKHAIPYYITGAVRSGAFTTDGYLTVNPGVVMKFASDRGISVGEYSSGYIKMAGTPTEHITLTAASATAWQGICFQSTNSQNQLSYVDIDKGGSLAFTGAPDKKGNIVIGGFSAGNATIDHCTVNNSAAYGIFVAWGSTAPTISNVTYSGNTLANYYAEP